jgi:hypothetical protein
LRRYSEEMLTAAVSQLEGKVGSLRDELAQRRGLYSR